MITHHPLAVLPSLLLLLVTPMHAKTYSIDDFGAVGDGRTLNTIAIQKAIDQCGADGGGCVVVPRGVFLSGTLQLRSNVELHLERAAVLKGSAHVKDYELNGRRVGLLYTDNAEHVALTGPGNIDGNGDAFMVPDQPKTVWPPESVQFTRQGVHFREAQGVADGPVAPRERPYQMIIFTRCRDVTLRDLLITNSPFWTVHCADCDSVIATGVRLFNNVLVPNNDGMDFTSCSNVVVADCDIRAGDDALVFAGYAHHHELPGYHDLRHDSENITVTNCTLLSRSSAIRIGGADQNAMRRYTFSNLVIHDSNRGIGIFLREEGSIEDMTFTNIVIDTHLYTGDWWGNGEPIHLSAVRNKAHGPIGRIKNLKFAHIIARGEAGLLVVGTPESVIEDVSFEDVTIQLRDSRLNESSGGNFDLRPVTDPKLNLFSHDISGLDAEYVKNLSLRNVTLTWDGQRQPFFARGLAISHFDGVRIDGFRGAAAPSHPDAAAILLRDGRGYEVTNSHPTDPKTPLLQVVDAKAE